MLDTDQLRSFLAIVDTGSFTRAAERVNKTQSAVSMHVRRLEERLDRPLFVKDGRGAKLSPDGERLVEHARRILAAETAALADLTADGLSGRVTFGIPDDYAEPYLPDIVARFSRAHPRVELSIVCLQSIELAERVQTGSNDVAVVTDCAEIRSIEIIREETLHWVAGLRAGPVEERRPLPLALSTPSCAWRRLALAALTKAGVPSKIVLMSSNYAAIAPIVQAGLGPHGPAPRLNQSRDPSRAGTGIGPAVAAPDQDRPAARILGPFGQRRRALRGGPDEPRAGGAWGEGGGLIEAKQVGRFRIGSTCDPREDPGWQAIGRETALVRHLLGSGASALGRLNYANLLGEYLPLRSILSKYDRIYLVHGSILPSI